MGNNFKITLTDFDLKRIKTKHIVLAVILIATGCLLRSCCNGEEETYASPQGTNTIIVQYDFMSRPTVYKKHWLWDKGLWSYPGSGFMETVHLDVEWLSEDKIRLSYDDKNDKYDEEFIIEIPWDRVVELGLTMQKIHYMSVVPIFIANFALTKSVIWKSKSKQTEETSKLANRNP